MFVGRRIICTYNRATKAGCGGPGVGGVVVHDEENGKYHRVYIVFDNCVCAKPYNGGCNGYLHDIEDDASGAFKWAESDNSGQLCNNGQLCNCTFDIIMVLGCQCGGK